MRFAPTWVLARLYPPPGREIVKNSAGLWEQHPILKELERRVSASHLSKADWTTLITASRVFEIKRQPAQDGLTLRLAMKCPPFLRAAEICGVPHIENGWTVYASSPVLECGVSADARRSLESNQYLGKVDARCTEVVFDVRITRDTLWSGVNDAKKDRFEVLFQGPIRVPFHADFAADSRSATGS